jgi:coenzyme PQQ biosynthesis protein PqqD
VALTATSVPVLWRLARLDFDPVRQQRVLLYPEGVVLLNNTGAAILDLCDGDVAAILGEQYHREVVDDVIEYLSNLADRELIRVE